MRATTFTLPGGLVGDDGACHRGGALRPLDGHDEEWVHALPASMSRAAFVTELLRRCVIRVGGRRVTRHAVRDLSVGDRDFLVLKLYQATFGDRLSLVPVCPRRECGAKMDLDLNLSDIPVEERPLLASYRVRLEGAGEIEFRLPRGGDQERLAALSGVSPEEAHARLLEACVLAGELPAGAREALTEAIEQHAPHVESDIELTCPECGHLFDAEIDMASTLLQEVARGRAAFERGLHLLALHYHWPPSELYALTRPRRQRFLRLLVDELGARAG